MHGQTEKTFMFDMINDNLYETNEKCVTSANETQPTHNTNKEILIK